METRDIARVFVTSTSNGEIHQYTVLDGLVNDVRSAYIANWNYATMSGYGTSKHDVTVLNVTADKAHYEGKLYYGHDGKTTVSKYPFTLDVSASLVHFVVKDLHGVTLIDYKDVPDAGSIIQLTP